jgi:hypothetical protein
LNILFVLFLVKTNDFHLSACNEYVLDIDCVSVSVTMPASLTSSAAYLVIARGRIRIQRMRRGELRSQPRNLAAVSLDVLGQRRLGGGGALLWGR